MKRVLAVVGMVTAGASGLVIAPGLVQAADVSVGVNIGVPPPPPAIVLPAPPPLVIVPGTPVYYAPSLDVNFFAYGGRYYRHHNGAWFMASSYAGPWGFIAVERVPRPVLTVPTAYYKIPPGHMKKGGRPHWAGHGKGRKHKWKDD